MNPVDFLCRSRDFQRRLEESRGRLYRMAYAWTHNAALADDLAQETLAKALRKTGQLRDPAAIDAWLFSILSNCFKDHLRRDRETDGLDGVDMSHNDSPERLHGRRQVVARVRDAVAVLSAGQRQVLTLIDLEGFAYAEVADILEVPIGTVMSRLCRARAALKELLLDLRPEQVARPAALRRIK
jgi:RNA polymerase sigma-70 factor (ECF subfamily)